MLEEVERVFDDPTHVDGTADAVRAAREVEQLLDDLRDALGLHGDDAGEPKVIGVWPATVELTAGPSPLNCTCTRSSSSDTRNSSPTRCEADPIPAEA